MKPANRRAVGVPLSMEALDDHVPGPGELLAAMRAGGICGTEPHCTENHDLSRGWCALLEAQTQTRVDVKAILDPRRCGIDGAVRPKGLGFPLGLGTARTPARDSSSTRARGIPRAARPPQGSAQWACRCR